MTNTKSYGVRRLAAGWWVLIVIVAIAALIAGFFAMVAATHGPARSEPAGTIAVADVDGRNIAVVVYRADTIGHLDLFRIESMGYSTQAEAFDLDTGERVWDTLLFAEFGGTEAEVLGMGTEYVYISSASGLLILDAATGEIVSREGEIGGLGEDYIAAIDAYVWDADAEAVVLLDAHGAVLSVPVDELGAVRAPEEIASRWAGDLNTGSRPGSVFSPDSWEHLDSCAHLPGGESIEPVWASDGWDVDVLLENATVLEATGLAAGWQSGIAVTQTDRPAESDAGFLFQVGDLATGGLIGTAEGESSASGVAVSGAGQVVLLTKNDSYQGLLLVASTDGIRSSVIGERAFLGW